MTLHFEILRPGTEEVLKNRIFQPGEGSTVTNNLADGSRELYVFGCAEDNTFSFIQKSTSSNDVLLSRTERYVPKSTIFKEVATLSPDQPFTISVVTDRGTMADVRLTHKLP